MHFSWLTLILFFISQATAVAVTSSHGKNLIVTGHKPLYVDVARLFPADFRIYEEELRLYDNFTTSVLESLKSLGRTNPKFVPLFLDPVEYWTKLTIYPDVSLIAEKDILFPMETMNKAVSNVVWKEDSAKNRKTIEHLIRQYMSWVGFMCYLFRIRGLAIPLILVKTPGELFGIMLRFASYDVWKRHVNTTAPVLPGLLDEDQIQRHLDGYHPKDGDIIVAKWNTSSNDVTNCTINETLAIVKDNSITYPHRAKSSPNNFVDRFFKLYTERD